MNKKHNEVNQESLSLEEIMKIIDKIQYVPRIGEPKSPQENAVYTRTDETTYIKLCKSPYFRDKFAKIFIIETGVKNLTDPIGGGFHIEIKNLSKGLINRLKGINSASVYVTGDQVLANYKGPEVYPIFEKVKTKYEAQEKAYRNKKSEIRASIFNETRDHIRTL